MAEVSVPHRGGGADARRGAALQDAAVHHDGERVRHREHGVPSGRELRLSGELGYRPVRLVDAAGTTVWLHLTDGRSWRTGKQILGPAQRLAIEQQMAQAGPSAVHLLASGSALARGGSSAWEDRPDEWRWLRRLASQHRLLVLSGDIHRNDNPPPRPPDTAPGWGPRSLWEATSSGAGDVSRWLPRLQQAAGALRWLIASDHALGVVQVEQHGLAAHWPVHFHGQALQPRALVAGDMREAQADRNSGRRFQRDHHADHAAGEHVDGNGEVRTANRLPVALVHHDQVDDCVVDLYLLQRCGDWRRNTANTLQDAGRILAFPKSSGLEWIKAGDPQRDRVARRHPQLLQLAHPRNFTVERRQAALLLGQEALLQ